ncbi:M15 family peptidase [Providencia huaxiensis]|uniref:M15 family peptidase n=1 Tax=Providencia huaxiensis TaxID=2027290 RepID=UPI001E48B941|nr:M15 family peptidase [Providencia huaxiensis]MCD2528295.1 M15 family peptidase [Providencia huaxiensis]
MKKPFVFSQRSKNSLEGINPILVKVLYRALEITTADFAVIEGVRSKIEQQKNVAKGVSQTPNSRHLEECTIDSICIGNAVDILPTAMKPGMNWNLNAALFDPVLLAIKQAGDELGVKLRFGKNWTHDPSLPVKTKFPDYPHVEIPR